MTIACQPPLSVGFSRQEYLSGLPFPSPGDLPDPGTEPESPALAGGFFTTEPPGKLSYDYFISYHVIYHTDASFISSVYIATIHSGVPAQGPGSHPWHFALLLSLSKYP